MRFSSFKAVIAGSLESQPGETQEAHISVNSEPRFEPVPKVTYECICCVSLNLVQDPFVFLTVPTIKQRAVSSSTAEHGLFGL